MTNQNNENEEKSMTALMNLDKVEELMIEYDNPTANIFDMSHKLEELVVASDNKLALVKTISKDQKQA